MKHERITQGQEDEPGLAWIIAAHEAGMDDPDPFYERTDDER